MQLRASLFCCVVWVVGCGEVASTSAITVQSVVPRVVDPLGHSRVTVHGAGFLGVTEVAFGGVVASQLAIVSDTELVVTTAPLPVGASYPARVTRGNTSAILDDAITVWSPAELPDARLYDALSGIVGTSQNGRSYEWAKLTPELHPDWPWRQRWRPARGSCSASCP